MKKYKFIKIIAMVLTVLLLLPSCSKSIPDGITCEVFTQERGKMEDPGRLYSFQNGKQVGKSTYNIAFRGGIPSYITERARSHFDTEGEDAGKLPGQLDDYYVDETTELYLFYTPSVNIANIKYYENNVEKEVVLPEEVIDCQRLRYRDGYLYLIARGDGGDDFIFINVAKIELATNQYEILHYKFPQYGGFSPIAMDNVELITKNDNFVYAYMGDDEKGRGVALAAVCRPNGTYTEIKFHEFKDNDKPCVSLFYNTEDGFAMLETLMWNENSKKEDFYLKLRYFDENGKELSQKKIDCTEILAQSKKEGAMYMCDAQNYHDGTLYITTDSGWNETLLFRYNEKEDKITYDGKVNGGNAPEMEIVEYRNGIPCSLQD